jgi:hypothetical protein
VYIESVCFMRKMELTIDIDPCYRQAFSQIWGDYVSTAKEYGKTFSLTQAEFLELITTDCHYCGRPPHLARKPRHLGENNNQPFVYNGIDRMNCKQGYDYVNCVPCCFRCNKMKGSMDYDVFTAHVQMIAENIVG